MSFRRTMQTEYRCLDCNAEFTGTGGGWAFE